MLAFITCNVSAKNLSSDEKAEYYTERISSYFLENLAGFERDYQDLNAFSESKDGIDRDCSLNFLTSNPSALSEARKFVKEMTKFYEDIQERKKFSISSTNYLYIL